jgi:hypothetical protein
MKFVKHLRDETLFMVKNNWFVDRKEIIFSGI